MNTLGKKKSGANPRVNANFFSRFTHWYLNDLFRKGFRGKLSVEDMYEVEEYYSAEVMHNSLKRAWEKQLAKRERNKRPSLFKAIASIIWSDILIATLIVFIEELSRVIMPFLLGILLQYFSPGQTKITKNEAYIYAGGIGVCVLLSVIMHHPFFYWVQMAGLKLRSACSCMIYEKLLTLSPTTLSRITTGHVTNLLSADCQMILMATYFCMFIVLGPLMLCIVAYLLYRVLGWSSFSGVGVLLLLLPVHVGIGKLFAYIRRKVVVLTDKRVSLMSEVISAMRVIKMYTWEASFARLVGEARRKEINKILNVAAIRAATLTFPDGIPHIASLVTFTVHYLRGEPLHLADVLSTVALFNSLRVSLIFYVPLSLQETMQGYVGIRRIQKFLELKESSGIAEVGDSSKGNPYVEMRQVTAAWDKNTKDKNLKNVALNADNENKFCMVIGPVGSGKSTLLAAILGELESVVGTLSVSGTVAYSSQQAWIFSGTVRENILFGKPMNSERYRKVVYACALEEDFAQLPKADSTLVGERGVSLSGGQRARVSLARAVYHNADIYLLDDPLSAVDTRVGRHIFEHCFCGILKEKVKVLVTHQLHFLGYATEVICMKEGKVISRGTYADLIAKGIEVGSLISEDDSGSDDDRDSAIDDDEVCSGVYGQPRYRGVSKSSSVSFIGRERSRTISETSVSLNHCNMTFLDEDYTESNANLENNIEAENKIEGGVRPNVYLEYMASGISGIGLFLLFIFTLATQFMMFVAQWWLAYWAENEEKRRALLPNQTLDVQFYSTTNLNVNLYIYIGASLSTFLVVTIRGILIFLTLVIASRVLHDKMFNAVLNAPIYFFDTNPVGRILNRFSKDIFFMDDELPMTCLDFLGHFLMTLTTLIVNVVSIPYILLVIAPLFVIFMIVRAYFVRTSREVKRLEAVSRSPLYSHLSGTLQGLSTIQAYKAESLLCKEFYACVDHQSEGWFLFLASSRWFGIRLDTVAAVFVCCAVFAPLVLQNQIGVDNAIVSLALSYALTLTGAFQWCVRQSAQVENLMTSVERVIEYSNLPPEDDEGTSEEVDDNWPKYGLITAEMASFSYHDTLPYVLKNLFFCIRANEKVGVVGRTGAGKSSLISMLFRMAHLNGTVRIDGIATTDIKLIDLRSKISVIPQDPILFSGSLRRNLDPFDEYVDADIWDALEEVQLKDNISALPDKLNTELSEAGSNFSVGQRQLLCLSRALLRKNKILVIDEATANVDQETDNLIQETIRQKFRNCTVITVAHRLNTVMDSDRIMVLNEGKMVEFDEPIELLRRQDSALRKLVEHTGKASAARLLLLAEEARDYRNIEREENEPHYPGKGIKKSKTKDELLEMFGTRIVYETSL